MADIISDAILKAAAEKFGKNLADAASKHFASQMSAAAGGGKGAPRYVPNDSRGGSANRSPLTKGGGTIGSSHLFEEEVKKMADAFGKNRLSSMIKGVGTGFKNLIHPINAFHNAMGESAQKRMEAITGDAERAAKGLSGVHKRMAEGLIKYVKENGTNIERLDDNALLLSKLNEDLNNIGFGDDIDKAKFGELIGELNNLKDAMGVPVDFFEAMPSHLKKAMNAIVEEGVSRAELTELLESESPFYEERLKLYNTQQEALGWLTTEIETTADTVANVGVSMAKNTQNMLKDHAASMKKYMQAGGAAVGYGMFQYMEDTMYQYQTSMSRSYHKAAMVMGMSHRQVQDAMLDYRDTLRTEAGMAGTDMYSDASLESMKRIQNLGKTFRLIGDEAFRFGMQMMDTARLAGMAGIAQEEMVALYGDAAKALNMTVPEFGEFFNTMAKDPAFLGFVNDIKSSGGNLQKGVEREITNRIRMNKILGLSNENLQARLNLENAKRWGPIVDRYRSKIGASQLISTYEKQLGISLSDSQQDALKQYAFNPATLTKAQKKVFNDLVPTLMNAPEMLQEKLNSEIIALKEKGDPASLARAASLENQRGVAVQLTEMFGGWAGKGIFDPENALRANAALRNASEASGMSPSEILEAIRNGTVGDNKHLQGYIDSVTGSLEKTIGDGAGLDGLGAVTDFTSEYWAKAKELFMGVTQSGVGKAALGAGGAIGSMAIEYMFHKKLLSTITGASGAAATLSKGTGLFARLFPTFARAGSAIGGLAANAASGAVSILQTDVSFKSIGGSLHSMGSAAKSSQAAMTMMRLGALKSAGALGLAATAGAALGYGLYSLVKDKAWFTDSVDTTLDFLPNLWSKLTDDEAEAEDRKRLKWQKDNINLAPKFDQLTREQQKQYTENKQRQAAARGELAGTQPVSAAASELKKASEALLAAQTMKETDPVNEQVRLAQRQVELLEKGTEIAEKNLHQSKEQSVELQGGFKLAQEAARKARFAGKAWKDNWEAQRSDAAAQYTA